MLFLPYLKFPLLLSGLSDNLKKLSISSLFQDVVYFIILLSQLRGIWFCQCSPNCSFVKCTKGCSKNLSSQGFERALMLNRSEITETNNLFLKKDVKNIKSSIGKRKMTINITYKVVFEYIKKYGV